MNPLDIRFEDIKLPDTFLHTRILHCVSNENMETLGDIVKWTEAEWLRVPNFGFKSLKELKKILAGFGLELAGKPVKETVRREKKYSIVSWQPIKTAPLCDPVLISWVTASGKRCVDVASLQIITPDVDTEEAEKFGCNRPTLRWEFYEDNFLLDYEPTHWMRIPDPPEVANVAA